MDQSGYHRELHEPAIEQYRNQAIGILMHAYDYIKSNPMQAVDLYTRQCSVGVNAKDLAMIAATLAFDGRNPVTGKQMMERGEFSVRAGRHRNRRALR